MSRYAGRAIPGHLWITSTGRNRIFFETERPKLVWDHSPTRCSGLVFHDRHVGPNNHYKVGPSTLRRIDSWTQVGQVCNGALLSHSTDWIIS